MPRLKVNGADLHYEEQGAGPEAVVFAHGLLWSGRMFDRQVAALAGRYRCVTFDFRGQGGSAVTGGGYDMDSLTADAADAAISEFLAGLGSGPRSGAAASPIGSPAAP